MRKISISFIKKIKKGTASDIRSTLKWISGYARRYWKYSLLYTVIGLCGSAIALISSLISKNLVDMITGYQSGPLVKTFGFYIGFSAANILISQMSVYLSNLINIRVDNEIKSDIFHKILITDLETVTNYHTGDLLTRWNLDASALSGGILSFFPNLIINAFRFITSFIIIIYYDVTFAVLALAGLPLSILLSRSLLRRMQQHNKESAAMNAKINDFNQETFSNIQTIKAFDIISIYHNRLKQLQQDYTNIRIRFQKVSMVTSILVSLVSILVSNVCYAWGIYLVWNHSITYGTMTLFLSLSGSMTGNLNSLVSMIPGGISLATSAGRLKDIIEMPQEEYSDHDLVDRFYQASCKDGISLCINNLCFSYHTGKTVLRNCSIEAHPHEVIALIGPSGEGKTTLLRVLLSLLHPQDGECRLYRKNHPDSSLKLSPSTRKLFSYVPQGNTMFSGTIAQNMRAMKPDANG